MTEKIGRNDPCSCGSGKKYKNCCMQKQTQASSSFYGKRKFTAKVLSSGGTNKQQQSEQEGQLKPVDYSTLMERSFGEALHSHENKPPIPENLSEYLPEEKQENSNETI